MVHGKTTRCILALGWGMLLAGGLLAAWSQTQQTSPTNPPASKEPVKDGYQRSADIYHMRTTAKSGPLRGEEIYYFKCYVCHNALAKAGPLLRDLYKRPKLLSGEPVNDQTVAQKIREGGPAMPAYRSTLTDADLADLLSYFREGKCCFEGDNPPPNPRYRYHKPTSQ